jgi:hypothetical protein
MRFVDRQPSEQNGGNFVTAGSGSIGSRTSLNLERTEAVVADDTPSVAGDIGPSAISSASLSGKVADPRVE